MKLNLCVNDTEYIIEGSIVYDDDLDVDSAYNVDSGDGLSDSEVEQLLDKYYAEIFDEMLIEYKAYADDYAVECQIDNERYEADYEDRFTTY